ncbi:hypothetical protein cypCar_00046766, partial [Cyprinus carpio]
MRGAPVDPGDPRLLFDDTSAGGIGHRQALLSDPVSNLAMVYGSSLASHGREMMDQNLDRFIPISKLKYYFAVDTVYVGKKLGLLVFPYMHD